MPRDGHFITHSVLKGSAQSQFPTVAEILLQIDEWNDLKDKRRMELRAALRVLARVYGQPLEAIRLDPADLAKRFLGASAASVGIRPSSLTAYQSTVRSILRRLNLIDQKRRRSDVLVPEWAVLRDRLPDQFISIRLQDFMAFCSDQGVAPSSVGEDTPGLYLDHIRARRMRGDPSEQIRRVVKAWNRAQTQVEGWPTLTLCGPDLSRRYAPPLSAYPGSFQQDVAAFERSMQPSARNSLFDATGTGRDLRPHTIRLRLSGVRYAAAALVHSGIKPEEITSLAFLLRIDNLRTAVTWHWQRANRVVTDHVASIRATMRILAKHHVEMTDADRAAALKEISKVSHKKRLRMAPSREARLQQLDDRDTEAKLLHVSRRVMLEAKQQLELGQLAEAGWLAGAAVAIGILLRCPLRISNITSLRMGVELVKLDARKKLFAALRVEGANTKNGEPADFPIGEDLGRLIEQYVTLYRCHLPNSDTAFLFPHRDRADMPRVSSGLGSAITHVIHRHVGVRMTPHDFRAFAGVMILRERPDAINDLRLLLGHKDLSTTLTYYASLQPKQAAARYNQLIDRSQSKTKLTALASFSKLIKPRHTSFSGKPRVGKR